MPKLVQHGFRGTGMVQVYNPRILIPEAAKNVVPDPLPAVPSDGPRAKDVYKNVQVLGDVSAAEFTVIPAIGAAVEISPKLRAAVIVSTLAAAL